MENRVEAFEGHNSEGVKVWSGGTKINMEVLENGALDVEMKNGDFAVELFSVV